MGKNNDIPLHKRAHFRKVRAVITEIAKYEGINIHDYDLMNMRVYDTIGQNQTGKNTSYNTDSDRSIFVEDNKYDVFEAPRKNNSGGYFGEFLFFIHNTSFDYYYFGTMNVNLDKYASKSNKQVEESVYYKNYGKYTIVYTDQDNHITKIELGTECDPGFYPQNRNYTFDSFNVRKHAHGTSNHKILRNLGVQVTSTKKIIDNKAVKIHKNKKKRRKY